jgi:hypothetical protein
VGCNRAGSRWPLTSDPGSARGNEIHVAIQVDLGRPVLARKIFRLCRRANHLYDLAPFLPRKRGVSRPSRTLGKECGGRASIAGRAMVARTAKSCGSGTPTLVPSWRRCSSIVACDGARKPGPREEYEGNRKTIAQGMPVDFGVPVVTTLVCFLHLRTRLWVQRAPGIPCALFSWRTLPLHQPGHDTRRGTAGLCPALFGRCLTIE